MVSALLLAATVAPSTTCFRQQQVYAAPVVQYALPVQHVNVYYGVGQQIQLGALVTKQLRSDSDYQQFLRWKAEKHSQPQQEPMPPNPPMQGETIPPPDPAPDTATGATVANTCAKCHSGAAPKGNFYMDGVSPLADIGKPVERIMLGEMPPLRNEDGEQLEGAHVLTPLQRYQIIEDLTRLKLLGDEP